MFKLFMMCISLNSIEYRYHFSNILCMYYVDCRMYFSVETTVIGSSVAGGCGSCYAFASVGLNEARLRIITNNTAKLTFSPQDIVECSRYSQG